MRTIFQITISDFSLLLIHLIIKLLDILSTFQNIDKPVNNVMLIVSSLGNFGGELGFEKTKNFSGVRIR